MPDLTQARGVYAIAPTPFTDDGAIDYPSTDRLIEFYRETGVHGITILGVMGEAPKLSDTEQKAFVAYFLRGVGGRIPVIVGVSNPGIDNLLALSNHSMAAGAAGVMIAGIPGLRNDDQILAYFTNVFERLGSDVPVCLQDYPPSTTVYVSTSLINRLINDFLAIKMFKHEDWPGYRKLSSLHSAMQSGKMRRVSILTGNGGICMPQEMLRGADGIMTGLAFPEMLVEVYNLFADGQAEKAEDLYDLYLPFIRHEQQIGIGLAIRKETFRMRSVLRSAKLRDPGPALDSRDVEELRRLLARLKRKLQSARLPVPSGLEELQPAGV